MALVLDDGRTRFGQSSSVIKINDHNFEVIRAGVVSEQTLRRLASLSIVFVCTGNTCRSPMAEVDVPHDAGETVELFHRMN